MEILWTKVNKVIKETSNISTFILDTPENFSWDGGAHTHLALEGFNLGEKPNRELVRHMSISTLPKEGAIGITTRVKEECSEFKEELKGDIINKKVALFKTINNIPLRREFRPIYLISSGVALATLRPLLLEYLNDDTNVASIHSLNVESSGEFLYTDLFKTDKSKGISSKFVTNRDAYYQELSLLALDKTAIFYLVGSDEFLMESIAVLKQAGIWDERIMLDKHDFQREHFLGENQ